MRNRALQPDEFTLCALLKAAAVEEDKRRVAHTWDELVTAGVVPTHVSHSALVVAYVRCGAPEEALLVLNVMEREGTLRKDDDHARVAFNILLTSLTTGKQADKLKEDLLARMRMLNLAPDAVTYNALMAHAETPEGISDVMAQMEAAGLAPGTASHNIWLRGFVNASPPDMEAASDVVAQMARIGVLPDAHTYGLLIKGYGRLKDAKAAFSALTDMRRRGTSL